MALPRRVLAAAVVAGHLVALGVGPAAAGTDATPAGAPTGPTRAAVARGGPMPAEVASDRLVIRLERGAAPHGLARLAAEVGAERVQRLARVGLYVVDLAPGEELAAAAAVLDASPVVAEVEADPVVRVASVVPDDPHWPAQWGAAKVRAPAAWGTTVGDPATVVAVVDTGVDPSHPDLSGALLAGRDLVNGDNDPSDDQGHGTLVAGIAAARSNNARGVAGACWACAILPVKVLDATGAGSASDAAAGVVWAADQGADVINLSFGSPQQSSALSSAVAYAQSLGAIVVAAAGNEGTTAPSYPAADAGVVGVAATTSNDARYSWSNHGAWVQVAAPGCSRSTALGGGYADMCGTSAAAPLVSGVAALGMSLRPGAATTVAGAINATAVDVGPIVAHGRVDAAATLAALATEPEPSPSPSPSPEPSPSPSPSPEPSPSPTDACPDGVLAGFLDVDPTSVHAPSIDCIAAWGIASQATTYRPQELVSRAQMAAFIARTVEAAGRGLPSGSDAFTDDEGSVHETRINQLAAAGIVGGVGSRLFAPDAGVTRAQMATFLVRADAYVRGATLPAGPDRFTDDNGDRHETSINTAAAAGLVSGTGLTTYGPTRQVRRDAMASFLRNLLERLVADGLAVPPTVSAAATVDGWPRPTSLPTP